MVSFSNLGDICMLGILVVYIIFYELGLEKCVVMGIVDFLIWFFIGIEDIEDLLDDFV